MRDPSDRTGPPKVPSRPVRASAAREYQLGDELLLYVGNRESAYALNESARAIWDLCDGTRTADDIARELARIVGLPVENLRTDVDRTVVELLGRGLLEQE